ncbi:TerD family protein [Streptomyces sp. NPDC059491]|uniref:TerD family protein n=1 Tax=Streptomyces sp. NPDC059491 TaxID=3346850 RepID=UPI0036A609CD
MTKGGNGFVPSVPLRIAVHGGLDAMALLLTEHGVVRGDGDVVFHGAPVHPSGAVRLTQGGGTSWLDVGLPEVEQQITRVLVVGSTDRGTLRDVVGPAVEAFAPDGTPVVRYDVTDAAEETAMVLAELYRRAGGWKFRAVGQGYGNGLAGLATDHGVDVADASRARDDTPPAARNHVPPPARTPAPPVPAPPPAQGFAPAPPPPGFAPPAPGPAAGPPASAPPVFAPPPAGPPVFAPPGFAPPSFAPSQVSKAPPPVAPVAPAAPAPTPFAVPGAPEPWTYGPVFAPYTQTGRDNDVITVDGLPPGPVIVQLDVEGDGYTGLATLNRRNKEQDYLVNSTEDDFRGRVLVTVPRNGTLRLKLEAEGPWRIEVSPLASAFRLTEAETQFRGPDVLLHTGGVADLAIQYRGDDNLIVNVFELHGHDDHTALPDDDNVVNEIGKRRETVPLPEGPLVVQFESADGSWRAHLKRVQPPSRRGRLS